MSELALLPTTYEKSASAVNPSLREGLARIANCPLITVGSGGSFTAAIFAANLHRFYTNQLAAPSTPLQLAASRPPRRSAVLIASSRGRNPDAMAALNVAIEAEVKEVLVLTQDTESPLARRAVEVGFPRLIHLRSPVGRDGYLATNTLLATVTSLAAEYARLFSASSRPLPVSFDALTSGGGETTFPKNGALWANHLNRKKFLIVLYGGWSTSAGHDLESRLSESGMISVQLVDIRNFAHGRHQWLVRNAEESAVLAFTTPELAVLAKSTLSKIPRRVPRITLHSAHDGPAGALALISASMQFTGALAAALKLDPGRPSVPNWCRQVYHLDWKAPPIRSHSAVVERKLGRAPTVEELAIWKPFKAAVLNELESTTVKGLILDYDGTMVDPKERFGPLRRQVASRIVKLCADGMNIGVATGRGTSVRRSLREAIPSKFWDKIWIGYYNTTDVGRLSDSNHPDNRHETADTPLIELTELLTKEIELGSQVDSRMHQVTVTPVSVDRLLSLWQLSQALIERLNLPVKSVLSSHSIDLIPRDASKLHLVNVLADAREVQANQIIRVGDQGAWPGNDFELLAHPLGLSVDEVSLSPLNCWNFGKRGERGTLVTCRYIDALQKSGIGSWRLRISDAGWATE